MPSSKNKLKSNLLKWMSGSFAIKIVTISISFISSVFFARTLGASGLGEYNFIFSWISLLAVPATIGLDKLAVKEFASYLSEGKYKKIEIFGKWSNFVVLIISILISIISIFVVTNLSIDKYLKISFCLGFLSLPFLSLRSLRLSQMRGLHKILIAQLPEFILAPLLLLLISAIFFWINQQLTVHSLLISYFISAVITFFVGSFLLIKSIPQHISEDIDKVEFTPKIWILTALPFMFLGSVQVLNGRLDVIMLGTLSGNEDVGLYSVADRLGEIMHFVVLSANQVLAPTFASLYSSGQIKKLQTVFTKSNLFTFLAVLPIAVVFLIFGKQLLNIFGSQFTIAYVAFLILTLGQLFNAFTASVATLLSMTGHQNCTLYAFLIGIIVNGLLNLILIPSMGLIGASIATTISTFLWNTISLWFVYKKTGLILFKF